MRKAADDRLQRLLAVVPWVAAQDGPELKAVCARFGYTPEELTEDLDLLFMCGLHPYTPDMLIEVDIADGRVWIRYAEYFARPLRLTPAEGLTLLAAGKSLLATPGTDPAGPLARGLDKLASALGVGESESLAIELGAASAEIMQAISAAVSDRRQVDIDYYAFGRDEWTRRVVNPYALFSAGGQWYLSAYCTHVGDDRLFRLDRVRSATVLESEFSEPEHRPEMSVYKARPEDERVTLDLEPGARWVIEQYPVERVEEREMGGVRVTMAVSERAWLERLLLRLGPAATVVEGDPGTAAAAARRIVSRYHRATPP